MLFAYSKCPSVCFTSESTERASIKLCIGLYTKVLQENIILASVQLNLCITKNEINLFRSYPRWAGIACSSNVKCNKHESQNFILNSFDAVKRPKCEVQEKIIFNSG